MSGRAAVDRLVERQFRRWPLRALDRAVGADADDVVARSPPLSTRAGVIQMSPFSSRIERLPPEVVVMR